MSGRFWHRYALFGEHRPLGVVLDERPLFECACGWVGMRLVDLVERAGIAGELDAYGHEVDDDELVWFPRRVWQRALDDEW